MTLRDQSEMVALTMTPEAAEEFYTALVHLSVIAGVMLEDDDLTQQRREWLEHGRKWLHWGGARLYSAKEAEHAA